jgi:hypothetical protein
MDVNEVGRWREELSQILKFCQERDPTELIDQLCRLAQAMGDEAAEALLSAHPDLFDYKPALTQAFYRRVVRKEIAEARRLLEGPLNAATPFVDVASKPVLRAYHRVGGMFEVLDFSACRLAVMVGCGYVPETMFHLHDRTNVPDIVGLDIDNEAVETARKLASRFGYSRVRAELSDGGVYEYAGAQVICITNMVSPKHAILSRIVETAPEEVRIVVRDPFSLRRLWSESSENPLHPELEVFAKGERNSTLARDVYLRRRLSRATR